jgi:hypothetical protein
MTLDRLFFLLAAIGWLIGGLRALIRSPRTAEGGGPIDWWLLGAGFVALTFVF